MFSPLKHRLGTYQSEQLLSATGVVDLSRYFGLQFQSVLLSIAENKRLWDCPKDVENPVFRLLIGKAIIQDE